MKSDRDPPAFPLPMATENARVEIVSIHGGSGLMRRLADLGLNVGCELSVRQRMGGQLVVCRGETRFALGAGMAQKILVRPVSDH